MGASRHAVASWEAAPAPTNALTTRESISNKRSHVVAKKMMPWGERNIRALICATVTCDGRKFSLSSMAGCTNKPFVVMESTHLIFKFSIWQGLIFSERLRARLEHGFFIGKVKEIKTEERKMVIAFGTKERSESFPLEYCSNNMISREKNIHSCLWFFDPSWKPDAAARLSSAGWRRFLCYKFMCSKQSKFSVPVFWNPVVFHFSSYLISAFFPIPVFWIPSFQTGPQWQRGDWWLCRHQLDNNWLVT